MLSSRLHEYQIVDGPAILLEPKNLFGFHAPLGFFVVFRLFFFGFCYFLCLIMSCEFDAQVGAFGGDRWHGASGAIPKNQVVKLYLWMRARGEPIKLRHTKKSFTHNAHIPSQNRGSQNVPVTVIWEGAGGVLKIGLEWDRRARECTFRRIREKLRGKCNCVVILRIRHGGWLAFPRLMRCENATKAITNTTKAKRNRISIQIRKVTIWTH